MPCFYGAIIADFCCKIKGQTPQKSSAKFYRVHNTDIILSIILKKWLENAYFASQKVGELEALNIQKDKCEKLCLTRKSTQARKIGENLAHSPGNTDSSPQNECCCQKSDGIFEKEKCKKGFLLLPEWHRAHRVDGALGFAGEMLGGLLERRLVLPQLALHRRSTPRIPSQRK